MIATGLETVGPPAKFFPIWRRDETMANKLARFAQHYRWLIAGDIYLLASVGIEEGRG